MTPPWSVGVALLPLLLVSLLLQAFGHFASPRFARRKRTATAPPSSSPVEPSPPLAPEVFVDPYRTAMPHEDASASEWREHVARLTKELYEARVEVEGLRKALKEGRLPSAENKVLWLLAKDAMVRCLPQHPLVYGSRRTELYYAPTLRLFVCRHSGPTITAHSLSEFLRKLATIEPFKDLT